MSKNIIIGVGNLLFCDDGVGVLAAKYIKENFKFEPDVEVIDGGTLGFGLIEYFTEYDNVFIIDTISVDDEAGTVYKIPSSELLGLGAYKKTAHEVEVIQMLEACDLYGKRAEVVIFGIVAEDISSVKIGLCENLKDKFDTLIEAVINSVRELDIEVTREKQVTLDEIINNLK